MRGGNCENTSVTLKTLGGIYLSVIFATYGFKTDVLEYLDFGDFFAIGICVIFNCI